MGSCSAFYCWRCGASRGCFDQRADERRVSPSEQGQLQGANSSIQSIANLVGPFLFALTFSDPRRGGALHLPGAPFLLAALLLALSAVICLARDPAGRLTSSSASPHDRARCRNLRGQQGPRHETRRRIIDAGADRRIGERCQCRVPRCAPGQALRHRRGHQDPPQVDHPRVINMPSEVITRTRVVVPMPVVKTVEIVCSAITSLRCRIPATCPWSRARCTDVTVAATAAAAGGCACAVRA